MFLIPLITFKITLLMTHPILKKTQNFLRKKNKKLNIFVFKPIYKSNSFVFECQKAIRLEKFVWRKAQ